MLDVTVLLVDDGYASTAINTMEVFQSAGVLWEQLNGLTPEPRFRVTTVSVDGRSTAPTVPLTITPRHAIGDIRKTDLIFVPSAGSDVDAMRRRYAAVIPWLRRWHRRGAHIAGVCSGVPLLAEAGLLDGRAATTHWAMAEEYRRRYPNVRWQSEYFITEADGVFCGGGINAATDLSLYLVDRFCGREVATRCARAMLIDMPRVWQSHYAELPLRIQHHDATIERAQKWLHENFQRACSFDALAAHVGMSPRNFTRRFKEATGETPLAYLHGLRVNAAKRFLEDGGNTVQEVSSAVGYDDVIFFRALFKRHTGQSPKEYRQRFGHDALTRTAGRGRARVPAAPTA
jgi:transcriptional regulator GlxA family with amidase domain